MKKSYAWVALALIGAVSCSGGKVNSSSLVSSTDGTVDEGDIVRDENGNILYDNVRLEMWSVTTGDDAKTQDEIIARFNETYAGMITVQTSHISRYELETQLQSTMEFDREHAPDLLFSHSSRSNEYLERDWLLPLEGYLDKADISLDKDDYVSSLLDAATIDGRVYGLPQDVHSAMVEVRLDILEKNGLNVPHSYAELVEVCTEAIELAREGNLWIRGQNSSGYSASEWRKASVSTDYEPFPIAYGDMWVHEFLGYTAAIQNGGQIVGKDKMPAFDSDEVANGLQLLRDWSKPSPTSLNRYAFSKDYGAEYDVGYTPFLSGNALFKLNGPWAYANDLTDFDRDLKNDGGSDNITTIALSDLFSLDPSSENASKIKGEGHAFMLFSTVKSTTKACAAMVFADWMVNNAGIDWARRGHLPSLKSVEQAEEYQNDPDYLRFIRNWGSCADYVVIEPTPYYTYIDTYFKNSVRYAMDSSSTKTIASVLKEQTADCIDYIELNR